MFVLLVIRLFTSQGCSDKPTHIVLNNTCRGRHNQLGFVICSTRLASSIRRKQPQYTYVLTVDRQ